MGLAFDSSDWTELDLSPLADAAFKGYFLDQMGRALDRYNAELALPVRIPFTGKCAPLIIKRYACAKDQGFQLHFDALANVAHRYLVFLWYLNDVQEGGETEFPALGLKIAPRTGRLLMFPPYWMYPHRGLQPISNDKYILSTYLLF